MNKIYKILISVLLMISLAPFSNVSAETPDTSKNLDTLISELIYYYGKDAHTDILRTLELIGGEFSEHYKTWNSVIHYWDWIENEMEENLTVAPDGLSEHNTHAFIVLGFALNSDGTMQDELIGRLEVALNSAKKYPNSYVLVTGGVNKNGWTEGDRMRDWLVANGLSEERIIVENKSSNTVQNASYSFDILYNNYDIETVSLISSQYHLKRGSIFYYTMSLLKAEELEKEPIEFLGEGNAGWYRADKTEESKSLKTRGMYSIANVKQPNDLPFSKLEKLNIEGDLEYYLNEKLNLKVYAQYNNNYVRDVTELSDITGFDSSEIGDKELEISYEENSIIINKNIMVSVLEKDADPEESVDRSELKSAVTEAEDKNEANYTKESWKVFNKALSDAKEVLENDKATQEEVNNALEALVKAMDQLEKQPEELVDKSLLESVVTEAEDKNEADYTKESWKVFNKALSDAKEVLKNDKAIQEEVNNTLEALVKATDQLEEQPDKSALELAVIEAEDKKEVEYTKESWKAFNKALANAKEVLENDEATQNEINKGLTELEGAISNLVKTSKSNAQNQEDKPDANQGPGKGIPKTATNTFNLLFMGGLLLLVGAIIYLTKRKRLA